MFFVWVSSSVHESIDILYDFLLCQKLKILILLFQDSIYVTIFLSSGGNQGADSFSFLTEECYVHIHNKDPILVLVKSARKLKLFLDHKNLRFPVVSF